MPLSYVMSAINLIYFLTSARPLLLSSKSLCKNCQITNTQCHYSKESKINDLSCIWTERTVQNRKTQEIDRIIDKIRKSSQEKSINESLLKNQRNCDEIETFTNSGVLGRMIIKFYNY